MLNEELLEIYYERIDELKSRGIKHPICEGIYYVTQTISCGRRKSELTVLAICEWHPFYATTNSIFMMTRFGCLFHAMTDLKAIRSNFNDVIIEIKRVDVLNPNKPNARMKVEWDYLETNFKSIKH